jgi:cytochrome c-type biogenesis protein CcmE
MKRAYWVAAGFAAAFVVLGITAFQKTLTPYVSFEDARKAKSVVQVMGTLDKESDRYDTAKGELQFDLLDGKGGKLPVSYRGIKPGNFKDAISIVAIGRYSSQAGRIEADKLLVKCPSKYQGTEMKTYGAEPAGAPRKTGA